MSIYNSKLNTIFIHIPRCAGSSIESIIGGDGHKDVLHYKYFIIGQTDIDWKNIFKFTIVRHPLDRFISCFKWYTENYEREDLDINDFAEELVEKHGKWDEDSLEYLMFKEQWRYACNQYHKPQVDFIGKFENLKNDWEYIAKKLGIKTKLPHLNKSSDDVPILTSKTKDFITKIYKKDFETFSYVP